MKLWADHPDRLMGTDIGRQMIHGSRTPNTRNHFLGDGKFLYYGWATTYLLRAVQVVAADFGLDNEVMARKSNWHSC